MDWKAATEGALHITERELLAPCRLRSSLIKGCRIARRRALIQVNPLRSRKNLLTGAMAVRHGLARGLVAEHADGSAATTRVSEAN